MGYRFRYRQAQWEALAVSVVHAGGVVPTPDLESAGRVAEHALPPSVHEYPTFDLSGGAIGALFP